MKIKVQFVVCAEDGREEQVQEVARAFIPNDGERYWYGERISTGFVESTVNQVISKRFCKRQQMQ